MSFAVTPSGAVPPTLTLKFFAFLWIRVWVARMCSTSDVPIPIASAPKAPCVDVWLSPHIIVVPGNVKPCSGPTTWTMPCLISNSLKYSTPNSLQFFSRASTCILDSSSSIPFLRSVVGTLWSTTASVFSGHLTFLLVILRPSNACGEVTSWTKCLSI